MTEVGTLGELGVGVGDVVMWESTAVEHWEVVVTDGWQNWSDANLPHWRIKSRAAPKLWRDMTPEEKGALLLAAHEGKVIENRNETVEWGVVAYPAWYDDVSYRIKLEPKVYAVEFTGHIDAGMFFRGLNSVKPQVRITFNLIDGKPDCASVKMDEL